jgi:glycosyltransferase involved in cell wall biosynthesis
MLEKLTISIVIPTRNRCRSLDRVLKSLMEDKYSSLEIIVVDAASVDGTVNLLRSYGERIQWISEPDNGEYDALNKGIRMATGEVIKLMSDDDVLRSGAFQIAADYLTSHPDVDIVFGQTAFWEVKKGQTHFIETTNTLDPTQLTTRHWLRQQTGLQSISAFIRRRGFDQIGLMSVEYACGDVEFWTRSASNDIKMGLIPDVVLDYYYTGQNGVFTKEWRIAAEMVRLNRLYGNTFDVLLAMWRHYPVHSLAVLFRRLGVHPGRNLRRLRT